jgi:hypothetical protein
VTELLQGGSRVEGDGEIVDGGDLPSQVGGGSGEPEVGSPAGEGPPAGTPTCVADERWRLGAPMDAGRVAASGARQLAGLG